MRGSSNFDDGVKRRMVSMTVTQTLQTERLTLRWFVPGDEDVLLAVWNDPAFVQNVGDRGIRTVEQAT